MQTEGQFQNMLGTIVIQIQTHEQFSRLELHVKLNISYVQVKQPNSQHVKYSRDANIFWSLILYNVTFNIELHDAIDECYENTVIIKRWENELYQFDVKS